MYQSPDVLRSRWVYCSLIVGSGGKAEGIRDDDDDDDDGDDELIMMVGVN